MSLSFPTNPTDGQQYQNWVWSAAVGAWTPNFASGFVTAFNGRSGSVTFQNSDLPTNVNVAGSLSANSGVIGSFLQATGTGVYFTGNVAGFSNHTYRFTRATSVTAYENIAIFIDGQTTFSGYMMMGIGDGSVSVPIIWQYVNSQATAFVSGWGNSGSYASWPVTYQSDRSVKTNIEECSCDALADIASLTVYECDVNMPSTQYPVQHHLYSLMTDEVQPINPSAVIAPSEPDGYSIMHPLPLCAMLVKAVQQLTQRLEALEGAAT